MSVRAVRGRELSSARSLMAEDVECSTNSVRGKVSGISLPLERPEDVALVELADGWHGVWHTDDTSALVPDALKTLAPHWIKLRSIRRQKH